MKSAIQIAGFFLSLPLAMAAYAEESRLDVLRSSYEREMDRVTAPVNQKYLKALQELKINYTTAGNLTSATEVEKEIARIEGNDPAGKERKLVSFLTSSNFVLKWGPSKSKQISFLQDGSIGIGRNDWEYSWGIKNGELHIIKKERRPSWVFSFGWEDNKFTHSETPHELADHRASLRPTSG